MDARSLSFLWKKLIMLIVVAAFASFVFGIAVEAAIVCHGKCEDIPDCDGFCKRVGFNSGHCFPPLYQYCCCQSG
ncbi:hypothetical protein CsSME_00020492 [Camellia sinensis var. sinensis]